MTNPSAPSTQPIALPCDFPAAHSMDTMWFAVDSQGRVGKFDSGEDGAVPSTVDQDESSETLDRIYAILIERARAAGVLAPNQHVAQPAPGALINEYISLRDIATNDVLFSMPLQFGDEKVKAMVTHWFEEDFEKAHRDGTCRGCCLPSTLMHEYVNGGYGEKGPDPYDRQGETTEPLLLKDLPADLRESEVFVDLSMLDFEKLPRIQPLEHIECETWGAEEYTTVSGEVRTIPGAKGANAQRHIEIQAILRKQEEEKKPWWKFW